MDLAVDGEASGFEHGLPGIFLGTSHIVVGVVAGDDHQRAQHDIGIARSLDGLDDSLAGGLFRLALDGADKDVLITELLHLGLHLAVRHLGNVCGAVTHEHERGTGVLGGIKALEAGIGNSRSGDGLGNSFLVGIDDGSVGADFAKQRLGNGDGFKLVLILLDGFAHLVILCAMHQVRRLDNEILHAIGNCTVERLIHVVDLLAIAGLHVVDDDLRGEGAADGPVGIRGLQGVFDALDVGNTAVIVGRAEGDNEQLVLADLILIARIVERSVAGIEAEVIGAGLVAFDELLLRIGQGVPGGLGRFALGVGLIGAGLDIDRVDQGGDIVGGCLIQLFLRGLRLFRSLLLGGRGLFGGSGLFGFCGVYGGGLVRAALAGGEEAQQHHGCEHKREGLFHVRSTSFLKCSEKYKNGCAGAAVLPSRIECRLPKRKTIQTCRKADPWTADLRFHAKAGLLTSFFAALPFPVSQW